MFAYNNALWPLEGKCHKIIHNSFKNSSSTPHFKRYQHKFKQLHQLSMSFHFQQQKHHAANATGWQGYLLNVPRKKSGHLSRRVMSFSFNSVFHSSVSKLPTMIVVMMSPWNHSSNFVWASINTFAKASSAAVPTGFTWRFKLNLE